MLFRIVNSLIIEMFNFEMSVQKMEILLPAYKTKIQGRAEDFVGGGHKEGRSPLGPQIRPVGAPSQDPRDGAQGKGFALSLGKILFFF